MKITIHQPEHFPYLGFFQKMESADLFVILDDVQYTKNNFQNRNKFKNKNDVDEWFTIELEQHANSKLIKDAVLDYVDFNICTLVVSALESIEDQYLVILITDEQLKSYYREELQEYLNNYIPLKSIYVSVSDGQDCQNYRKI